MGRLVPGDGKVRRLGHVVLLGDAASGLPDRGADLAAKQVGPKPGRIGRGEQHAIRPEQRQREGHQPFVVCLATKIPVLPGPGKRC